MLSNLVVQSQAGGATTALLAGAWWSPWQWAPAKKEKAINHIAN